MNRPRLGRGVLTLLAIVVSTALAPSSSAAQANSEVGPAIGSAAQAAAVEDLDGNAVELLDYVKGRPALLEFWATWCEVCEALQPQLDQIHESYGDRLNVVAVAVGVAQTPRRIRRHIEDHDPGYTYLYDVRGEAVRAFEAPTTSVVVILDAEGKVAYTGVGRDQDLIAAVERVVGS